MAFDLIIRNGTLIDGTGAIGVLTDVGVAGGRVTAIGDLAVAEAPTVLDARGKVVCPGIIDAHAHSDWCAFLGDEHEAPRHAAIRQGVTTEITGNCGLSPFPVVGRRDERLPPAWQFPSLRAYRSAVEDHGLSTNIVPLVGHAAVRRSVMGDAAGVATSDEIEAMGRLVAGAMDDGALGLSTGLAMAPGAHAAEEELVALARVVARSGGVYATHMRQEGDDVVRSVEESIRLGQTAGVSVEISHHKITGQQNWGRSAETLPLIEAARAGGLDVLIDVYPWTATSNGLMDAMPHWLTEGGASVAVHRLREAATVDRLTQQYGDAPLHGSMIVASCGPRPEFEGRSVDELAADAARTNLETVAMLLLADPATVVITFGMDDSEVDSIGAQPYALSGSDGLPFPGKQHPRVAGTFALLLGRAARGEGGATLPDTIHRMTGLTAERFGLPGRGVVTVGAVADLVVFDPATVDRGATYDDPWAPPTGIEQVLVAGELAVRDGTPTGPSRGRVLAAER